MVTETWEEPPGERIIATTEKAGLKRKGYTLGGMLGEGSYAKVKQAVMSGDNRRVAIKIINRRTAPKDYQEKFLPRELEILPSVRHKNVANIIEIFSMNEKVYIVMEVAVHSDLLQYIWQKGAIPDRRSCAFFTNLVDGVDYLHQNNIAHRDLKCENLLLDSNNMIKISDFGFARHFEVGEMCRTFCGSTAYIAPEILQGIFYEPTGCDVWSMGVILYVMVCGLMPYDDSNIKRMIRDQTESKVGFIHAPQVTKPAQNLIHAILESDVFRRFTIRKIRSHTWMTSR